MAFLRCVTCGGEYEDVLPDGMRYYHICPPLSARELADALNAGTVKLPPRAAKRYADARAADDVLGTADGEQTQAAAVLETLSIARPNARNENVDLLKAHEARDAKGGRLATTDDDALMLSTGAGVESVG